MKQTARILIAIALAAYFVYFAKGALRAHFAPDDIVNLGRCWDRGIAGSVWDNITFWRNAYRPFGALFYLSIYRVFGLNPLPYRIVVLLLIAANVYLTFRVADLVARSKAAAALI